MKLPEQFLTKMKALLGESEYNNFLSSYDQPRNYGLRINTLKISVEDFLKISPFELEPIPWTKDGFYYKEGENPGKHPYYYAGLYYIQEPSAMLPGSIIEAKPGERILDLCAAPGGKTVQIAAGMCGQGLLVANDINSDRVKALIKNIELSGVRNAIVTNDTPEKLSHNFREYFDKILIDAPCSGEGMFRKDEEAARSWEKFKCEKCAGMQWDILQNVNSMLKPGGTIVYSTCTFSPEEDEKMISQFLNAYENYETVEIPLIAGIDKGRPEWADGSSQLSKTVRLWPHKIRGEGHFVAMLRKSKHSHTTSLPEHWARGEKDLPKIQWNELKDTCKEQFEIFARENLNIEINGYLNQKGNNLYCLPVELPDLSGIKVAKFGWYLGEFTANKFEPSHSFIVSLQEEDMKLTIDLASSSREIVSYLKGETLMIEGQRGLTGICVDGYTTGWAKQTGDMLKNMYPKGWRKLN